MGRWLRDVLVVATLLASAHAPMAAERGTTASVVDVKVRNGLLTVNLRDAPLADVLLAIGEQAAFRVLVRGDAKTTVTRSFSDVPLAKGVQRLLGHASSWLMSHDGDALVKVHLYIGTGSPAVTSRTAQAALAVSLTDDHDTRLQFVKKIARQPHASATEGLILLVTGDRDPLIRRIAAIALGKIKGERSFVALASAVEEDEDGALLDQSAHAERPRGLGRTFGQVRRAVEQHDVLLESRQHQRRGAGQRRPADQQYNQTPVLSFHHAWRFIMPGVSSGLVAARAVRGAAAAALG